MAGAERKPTYIHPEDSSRYRDVSRSKNNIEVYKDEEKTDPTTWAIPNSPLLPIEGGVRDFSYQNTFKELLPREENLKDYIETGLADRTGKALALDIGGIGSNVFSGFSSGFFERTAGVALVDTRDVLAVDTAADEARHHSVIAGDFFKQDTRKAIASWLDGRKADLIFERMQGGLETVPRDPRIFTTALETLYSMLNERGMMFLQTGFRQHGDLKYALIESYVLSMWKEDVLAEPKPGLHIATGSRGDAVLIQKLEGAPVQLPKLDLIIKYGLRTRSLDFY